MFGQAPIPYDAGNTNNHQLGHHRFGWFFDNFNKYYNFITGNQTFHPRALSNILYNCCSVLTVPLDHIRSAIDSSNNTLCNFANYLKSCAVEDLSTAAEQCPKSTLEQQAAWLPDCGVADFLAAARNATCTQMQGFFTAAKTGLRPCFDMADHPVTNGTFGELVTNDTFFELEINSTTGAIGSLGPEISTTALVGMIAAGIVTVTVGLGVGAYCVRPT